MPKDNGQHFPSNISFEKVESDYFDFGLEEVEDYLRNCCNSPFMADKVNEIRKSITTPVRTKDLTDDEIDRIACNVSHKEFARAVIAADREKNK